jgi:hypothetical protein
MRSLIVAAFALSLMSAPAFAAPCKDAKGKFIKCPAPAAAMSKQRCKDAKGKFAKCGLPGTKPV